MTVAASLNAETGRIEKGGVPLAAVPGARNGASTAARNFKESLETQLSALNSGDTIAGDRLHEPEEMPPGTNSPKSKISEADMDTVGATKIGAKMLGFADSSSIVQENASQDAVAAGALPAATDVKSPHATKDSFTNAFMNDAAESSLRFGTERTGSAETGASRDARGQHLRGNKAEDRNNSAQPVSAGDTSALQFAQVAVCAVPVNMSSQDARCEAPSANSLTATESGSVVLEPAAVGRELHADLTPSSISGAELKGHIQTIAPGNAPGTLPIKIGQNEIQQGELQDEPRKSISTISKLSTDSVSGSGELAYSPARGKQSVSGAVSQTTLAAGQFVPVIAQADGDRLDTHAVLQDLQASDGARSAGTDAVISKPPQSDAVQTQTGALEAASSIHLAKHGEVEATKNPVATELRKTFEREASEAESVSTPGTLHVAEITRAGSAQIKADGASPGGGTADAFAALDSGTGSGPNRADWPRPGHIHAEAGYRDPALGWVGVRAESIGGAVHATLIPPSAEAAQLLSGHLSGLQTFLANNHTAVQTLTMAASGGGDGQFGGQGSGGPMQQDSGQQAGGNSREQSVSGQRANVSPALSGDSMSSTPGELLTRNMSGAGFTGGHISVRV